MGMDVFDFGGIAHVKVGSGHWIAVTMHHHAV